MSGTDDALKVVNAGVTALTAYIKDLEQVRIVGVELASRATSKAVTSQPWTAQDTADLIKWEQDQYDIMRRMP